MPKTLLHEALVPLKAAARNRLMLVLLLIIGSLSIPGAVAQRPVNEAATLPQTPQLMDRQKEITLALSACPSSLADKAGVYVLERSGYVKVRDSQNGFTAIVQHALPISQDPQCMNAEGTRTFLPRYLKVAELRAQGKTPDEIKQFVADAFAKGSSSHPRGQVSITCCRART